MGENIREEIEPMPGCYHTSIDRLNEEIDEVVELGHTIGPACSACRPKRMPSAVALTIPKAISRKLPAPSRSGRPGLMVIGDVCLCEYTDHGHCGVIDGDRIDNDVTLELLARSALTQVQAGADMVAPSSMMDGRYGPSAKPWTPTATRTRPSWATPPSTPRRSTARSAVAADSTPQFGDRRSYQMDPANRRMAMREIESDIAEGADIVMVKPAMAYMDVIKEARERYDYPLAAYNVSGEYSMVKAASAPAGSTNSPSPWNCSPPSAAPEPTSSSPTTPRKWPAGCCGE